MAQNNDWSGLASPANSSDWSSLAGPVDAPEQDGALTRGAKNAWNSVKSGAALLTGDTEKLAKLTAERDAYRRANPGTPEGNQLMEAWNRGDGPIGGAQEVVGEMVKDFTDAPTTREAIRATGKNLSAMGGGIVEQLPNAVAPMGGLLLGGAAGSAAGPVGTVLGGWAGAATGNTAVESGEQIDRALMEAGINPQDTVAVKDFLAKNGDAILGKAATKGAVIGAVDTATMGIGHLLLSGPGKAAVSRAIAAGVNPADEAAIKAAVMADPKFLATHWGARNAGVAALEPAGEFAGEYLGQGLATDEWDTKGAALEALSSLGQSAITFAGQKAYEAATTPFRSGIPDAPAPGTPATEEELNAAAMDLAGANTAFETLSGPAPRLGYDGVITVPTMDGGEATIDRRDGPISDAAVTASMLANETLLVPFATRDAAQRQLDARPDADRLQIIPHPRVKGRFAIAQRDRLSLQAMDEANARKQQLESEDGNAAEMVAPGNPGQGGGGTGSGGAASDLSTRQGGGTPAAASIPGSATDSLVGDARVADAALDELAPAPVQPVADMPGVQAAREQRLAQARAEAEARGATLVDEEASTANFEPTEAQFTAGNYKKGHVRIGPLDVSVENPVGSTRRGPGWEVSMSAHYGYVKRTKGADGEQVDVYIREGTANDFSGQVYVIDQFDPKTGRFDEHKAMVGYGSAAEAAAAYDQHFNDQSGPKRRRAVVTMPLSSFNTWARSGDTSRPLSQAGKTADDAQAEIEKSTGKLSRQRGRTPEQANAAREERKAGLARVEEAAPDATLAEVLGEGATVVPSTSAAQKILEQVARVFGKKVVFFRGGEKKADGFWIRGKTIYLNADASVSQLRILGHELTHTMRREAPAAYQSMFDAVKTLLTDEEVRAQYLDYFGKPLEGEITDEVRNTVAEEWMADLSGNRFGESAFWESVFKQVEESYGPAAAKGIINRLRMAIVSAINKLMSAIKGNKFGVDERLAADLDKVRAAVATGFADYAKAVRAGVRDADTTQPVFSGLKMQITREERELADKTKLTREELAKVTKYAKQFGLPPRTVEMEVRRIKARFPESAGWAPLEFLRVDPKTMSKKANEKNPLPSDAIFFAPYGYQFHLDAQGKDNKVNHKKRVKDIAAALAGEISGKYMAAQQGDPVAKVIMRQSDWYQSLRGKLRATFGGFGDFLAQLLGPTSANNPVEPNFKYGVEALKLATSGKWDNLFKEVFAWKAEMEAAAKALDDTIEMVRAEGNKGVMKDPRVLAAQKVFKEASKYKGSIPLRENGKQFGMATTGIQQILAETWGDKVRGDAPKTKNYYQNIMGRTFDATIDVWAARTLRRLANDVVGNFPRIPPIAETAVAGNVLADGVTSGSEFGFGQEVFRQAAEDLKASGIEQFKNVTPDAVQAMVWFIEKETWATRNWTTKVGEEGSIEHEMLLAGYPDRKQVDAWRVAARAGRPNPETKALAGKPEKFEKAVAQWTKAKEIAAAELARIERYPDRFVAGVTTEIPDVKPTDAELADTGRELEAAAADDKVMAIRAVASTGEFMGDFERTLDVELVARNGYDATPLWNKLVEIGDREGQQAVFLSRVLREDEVVDPLMHRPGVELYFAKPKTLAEVQPLMDMINAAGVHGMTMATEGRRTPAALTGKDQPITGIRMQHIPEFMLGFGYNVSMSNADIASAVEEAGRVMDNLTRDIIKTGKVATVAMHWYETRVHFYGDNSRITGDQAGASGQGAWSGRPIGEGLAGADRFARDGAASLAARRSELQQDPRRGAAKLSTRRYEQPGSRGIDPGPGRRGGTRVGQGGRVDLVGIHYSNAQRQQLNGVFFGTGTKSQEAERILRATDTRLKSRIYFYVDEGKGVRPEQGVGGHAHRADVSNLYDLKGDPLQIRQKTRDENERESMILDAGFDGYYAEGVFGDQGVAILMGKAALQGVTPEYIGTGYRGGDVAPVQSEAQAATPVTDRVAADRTLPGGRQTGAEWKQQIPEATMLEDDKGYYKDDVVQALRQAKLSLARRTIEVDGQTRPTTNSNGKPIAQTEEGVRNFWRWFGDSKVVDEQGRPLVVYHGTGADFTEFNTEGGKGKSYQSGAFFTPSTLRANTYTPGRDGGSVMPVYLRIVDPVQIDALGSNWNGIGKKAKINTPKATVADADEALMAELEEREPDPAASKTLKARKTSLGRLFPDEFQYGDETFSTDDLTRWAKKEGYEGVEIRNVKDHGPSGTFASDGAREPSTVWVAFDPTQIKSATGNNGKFDGANPDIRFSTPRFYSQLARSIEQAPDRVFGPATQVKLWLSGNASKLGVKKDEIQWTGINEWLDAQGKQKVSKAEVLGYLEQGGVQVEEVEKGKQGFNEDDPQLPDGWSVEPSQNDRFNYQVEDRNGQVQGYGDSWRSAVFDAYSVNPDAWGGNEATRYHQYVLPGGKNYRELLLTLPEKTIDIGGGTRVATGGDFVSGHWREKNILAHVRFNERADTEGNRVLFIEEIQSDWGQEGKKQGFVLEDEAAAKQRQEDARRKADALLAGRSITALSPEEQVEWNRLMGAASASVSPRKGVPPAPFVTDTKAWVALAIKRMMRYAADNGFAKVAFVNGQQSADRYDLSKQVDSLSWDGDRLQAWGPDRMEVLNETGISESKLEDYIGKEVAIRLVAQPKVMGKHLLSGEELKVGGEGMITFYDKIVPQVASDLLKKMGGKLEVVDVPRPYDLGEQYIGGKKERIQTKPLSSPQPGFTVPEAASQPLPLFSLRRRVDQVIANVDHAVDGLSNMPNQFDYLKDRYLALGRIARVDEIVKEIRDAFEKSDPVNKKAVYDYLTTRGATATGVPDPKIRSIAERIKKTIEYTGDALVARGLLDQEARDHYRDQYLPRMYLRHMLNDQDFKVIGMGKKPSDMGYLKHRKDIPEEIREVVLGEIKDPAFLSANAIGRAMRDVSLLDWMGTIAQNNDWVFPEVFANYRGKKVTAYWLRAESDRIELQIPHYTDPAAVQKAKQRVDEMRTLANQTLGKMSAIDHKVYKQIPDTRRYGLLRGMWVRREIYDDIMGASQIVNADPTWFEDWFGFGGKGTKLTQWWKFTKVALNPPGQIRNFISNMVMLQLSGVGLHKLPIRLLQAAREITNNGRHWQIAKKYGVTESTFTAQEMYRIKRDLVQLEAQQGKLSGLRWLMAAGAKFLDGVSNLYQFSEALGKTIKIIDEMEKGKSEAEAAIEAQKWLFDYSLVPQSVRIARNAPIGMPFLTYQVKVLPRLLEVAAKYPWRFLPWAGLLYGMQAAVASLFGVDDDDLDKLKKSLPEWLQDRGHTVFLPWRDDDGRLQVADVGYFFPWTFYSTAAKHALEGKTKKVLVDDIGGQFSAPIIGAGAALMSNYDNFTKRPIYNESDPVGYQAAAIANYAYDLMAPPFLSSHGFVSPMGLADKKFGGKMTQAVAGTTNKFGDPKATEEQALGALVGFNFYGMDPDHTRITNLKVMEMKVTEAERNLRARLMDRGLSDEQRRAYVAEYQTRMKTLQEEMVEYAKESEVPEQLKVRPQK